MRIMPEYFSLFQPTDYGCEERGLLSLLMAHVTTLVTNFKAVDIVQYVYFIVVKFYFSYIIDF